MTEMAVEELIETDLIPYEDLDDGKDHLTHIINPEKNPHLARAGMNLSGQDVVDIARMAGTEITALCGYKFIPVRNPEKYSACQTCFDVAGLIMSEG